MARSSTKNSIKAGKFRKQKLKRAGFADSLTEGISNGLTNRTAGLPSRPMRPKYADKSRGREPLVEPIELVTPQMRALEPGMGILAYKGVDEVARSETPTHEGDSQEDHTATTSDAAEFISLDFDDESDSVSGKLVKQFAQYEQENNEQHQLQPIGEFPAPWLDRGMKKEKSIGEHITAEVLEYLRYVSPTVEETNQRNDCIRRLRQVTSFLWPGCTMDVFGSYAMGLYLPDADIDVVISTAGSIRPIKLRNEMYRLGARMKKTQLADRVEVIAKARVPIVKYVDKKTGLNVDIAFDQQSGFAGLETVASWIAEQPALKPIVLVIKQFLKRRRLNEVVNGGLGGYAVICLTYSLLKSHKDFGKNPQLALENVGLLLIAFFDLYGHQFDYRRYAVSVRNESGRIMKTANPDMETQRPNGLAIEDPNDSSNNISKASFNYQSIERSFGLASDLLKRLSVAWRDLPVSQRPRFSFLGPLLRYDRRMAVNRRKPDLEQALKPPSELKFKFNEQQPRRQQGDRLKRTKPDNANETGADQTQTKRPRTATELRGPQLRTEGNSQGTAAGKPGKEAPSSSTRDPFRIGSHTIGSYSSSSDISDDEQSAESHREPYPKVNKPKKTRAKAADEEEDDDADSRTKITSSQRRQFWKRKGELQGEAADPDV